MIDIVERYTAGDNFYRYEAGPRQVRSGLDALQLGNNCMSLLQLVVPELVKSSLALPEWLDCYEMFHDTHYSSSVSSLAELRRGDMVWLGTPGSAAAINQFSPHYDDERDLLNWGDWPVGHVAIATEETQAGEPLLLHASQLEGTNVVQPLGQVQQHANHQAIYRISRLRAD